MGREVQRTLVQQALPDLHGWQVSSHYQPARALGGDFYDLFPLPDGRMALIIGDVSDKGIPASLVMASTRTLVRTIARRGESPGIVLQQANELMVGDIPRGMFVTCMVVLLDLDRGQATFANAGHNLPYLCQPSGVSTLAARGMPLGLLPGMDYPENQAQIDPGDLVLFYSDGLVEAHNAERQMYGGDRLSVLLHTLRQSCPTLEALPGMLIADLQDFTGEAHEQEDDITILAVQRPFGPEPGP
jgi:serine phosphatase RsbU (regulator of sigma subunit)